MNKNWINSPYRFFLIESLRFEKAQTTMDADVSVTFSWTLMTYLRPAPGSLRNKLQ